LAAPAQKAQLSPRDRVSAAHYISTLKASQGQWKWRMRLIVYDFLLMFSSNYGSVLHRCWHRPIWYRAWNPGQSLKIIDSLPMVSY